MLTDQEFKQIRDRADHEDIVKLVTEIDRLKQYIRDYGVSVTAKLQIIDEELGRLEAENARLLKVKQSAFVERDACINVLCQLAAEKGLRVGIAPENLVIVDLPSGQVSWEISSSEAHLFSWLRPYPGTPESIEKLSLEEKYSRIMNPGVLDPETRNPGYQKLTN